jgi:uncharacterized radical SAM superfamily Fe-S cluster-containing enzyme
MTQLSAKTESLCPRCLRRITARRIFRSDAVYLTKSCPEHGDLGEVLLWRNHAKSYSEWCRLRVGAPVFSSVDFRGQRTGSPPARTSEWRDGCPYECGLCANHKQNTCSAILEVTRRCNIRCPICFAASETEADEDPDLDTIRQMLQTILDRSGSCPIQLSGGEPTLRNDLPQIIALARKIGFDHIQINTNGVRLALDPVFAHALKDAGATDFFLQFDALTDETYLRMRGAALLPLKMKAIERCAELKIGVILVPTLVRNLNESQIGDIIRFAKKWMPTVRGVHFQPMTYLGRYPDFPHNEDRISLPDILIAIEEQTGGELKVENFIPPG